MKFFVTFLVLKITLFNSLTVKTTYQPVLRKLTFMYAAIAFRNMMLVDSKLIKKQDV